MLMKKALAIILTVLVADQASKFWVKTNMMLGQEFEVFPWFIIHFTENMGMAFGMELGGDWGKLLLSTFRMFAAAGLAWYLHFLVKKGASTGAVVALSLVLAGAIGNIIDGAFYGMMFSELRPGRHPLPSRWWLRALPLRPRGRYALLPAHRRAFPRMVPFLGQSAFPVLPPGVQHRGLGHHLRHGADHHSAEGVFREMILSTAP